LPDERGPEHGLRAAAIQRMRELGEQQGQARMRAELADRHDDLRRVARRGGRLGDVVGPGKRKNEFKEGPANRRGRRLGERDPGPQQFSYARGGN